MPTELEKGIAQTISDFFASLTKEPTEEIGGMLADRIKYWRVRQAVKLREKFDAYLLERGITNKREVPLKLAIAIADGATMEEDDQLHTEWAKLLANAVDPSFKADVRIAYTEILRSLTPFDARLLHEIHDVASSTTVKDIHQVEVDLVDIANRINASKQITELSRDCLVRQQCILHAPEMYQPGQYITHEGRQARWVTPPPHQVGFSEYSVMLTQLGTAFVRACR